MTEPEFLDGTVGMYLTSGRTPRQRAVSGITMPATAVPSTTAKAPKFYDYVTLVHIAQSRLTGLHLRKRRPRQACGAAVI